MQKRNLILTLTFLLLLALTSNVQAHGGHEKTETNEPVPAPAMEENIYAVEGEQPSSHEMDLPSTSMDMDMDMHSGHDESHKMMPQVKLSSHEWISPSRKGYKTDVGITVFAGLVFSVLSFKRPNE